MSSLFGGRVICSGRGGVEGWGKEKISRQPVTHQTFLIRACGTLQYIGEHTHTRARLLVCTRANSCLLCVFSCRVLWWHAVNHSLRRHFGGDEGGRWARLSLVLQWKQRRRDHPVSVHVKATWLRFRVTVASAWGVTLHHLQLRPGVDGQMHSSTRPSLFPARLKKTPVCKHSSVERVEGKSLRRRSKRGRRKIT